VSSPGLSSGTISSERLTKASTARLSSASRSGSGLRRQAAPGGRKQRRNAALVVQRPLRVDATSHR
jgi:hypothetical protein